MQEGLAALQIVACHFAAAPRRSDRGLGTVCRELQVGIIEASDYLIDLNAITNVDEALHDLAGHAEADSALNPRPHYPGIGQCMPADRFSDYGNPNRPDDLLFDLGLAFAAAEYCDEWQHQGHSIRWVHGFGPYSNLGKQSACRAKSLRLSLAQTSQFWCSGS